MAYFCPGCGNAVGANDSFCSACGTPLTDGVYENVESANPYDAGAPVSENAYWAADGETTVGPSFWGAFGYCLKNYCNFRGRATRTEYWGWTVVAALIGWALKLIALAATAGNAGLAEGVEGLWNLAIMLPALAAMGRRLHDVGWSAKQMIGPIALGGAGLAALIAGVGLEYVETVASQGAVVVGLALVIPAAIWQLVLGITAGFIGGTDGPNRFGGKRLNPSDVGR